MTRHPGESGAVMEMAGTSPAIEICLYLDSRFQRPGMTAHGGHFTSFLPVIFSRLPCMIALYLAFGIFRPSRIFSVSRM